MTLLIAIAWVGAVCVVPLLAYLGFLALLAWKPRPPVYAEAVTRFTVVVPAHDEEAGIADTVRSLLACDYPAALREVLVVADNCSDATAVRAREAGATVLERVNRELRGKGYALEHAFERVTSDAVVVVDADTVVEPNLLRSFDRLVQAGALAAQAEYGVRNRDASWRTRLMTVALAMFHRTRSLARERLGLSCGLRGNGMCFTTALLAKVPHKAYGLVEDVEYGLLLGTNVVRVVYAQDTEVYGTMVTGGKAAVSQRQRWEGGRKHVARQWLAPLVRQSVRERSAVLLDLALDIVVPPLGTLGALLFVFTLFTATLSLYAGHALPVLWPWVFGWSALLLYVARGIQHSGLGFRAVTALAYAPFYLVWKIVATRAPKSAAWVRTTRE